MKRNNILKSVFLAAVTASLGVAHAQVFTFTNGHLILGFQATGGQGVNDNVFVNLGLATTLRNSPSPGTVANLSSVLSSVYGNDWYTRTDLYFGVIANLEQAPASGFGSKLPVNGDPARTFYISQAATAPGGAILIPANSYPSASLGTAGTALDGMEEVLIPTTDGTGWNFTNVDLLDDGLPLNGSAGVLSFTTTQHATAWNNSWTLRNPTPGAAFSVFTGGIQQNFGKVTTSTYVDIQRVLATNTGAVPTGVVGGGQYITTIAITNGGLVTASSAASSSPYTTWITGTFAGGTVALADQDPTDDPDKDEIDNVMEFVLNGDPTVSNQSILPTLNASGSNFVFSFNRRDDSESPESTQTFQHSPDLVTWTDVAIGAASAGSVTVNENASAADGIIVTIPKGVNTKLFGRLKVVK